eukprot:NODE_110_length_19453_cov_0.364369.p12 type:complete len:127 gc:universal NODE_110_length_19453_cov_0.364369:2033-1653(-)
MVVQGKREFGKEDSARARYSKIIRINQLKIANFIFLFFETMGKVKLTSFPLARIKKVMQTDEEIGKVAQAAPVLVSKALELFLAKLLADAGEIAKENSLKKISPETIAQCVDRNELFDFLKDIVKT